MQTIPGRRVLGSTRLLKAFSNAPGLDRPTKLCYLLMCGYGRDSGDCYASAATLARDLRASQRQIERYREELRRHGWIVSNPTPGKRSHHLFLWHPIYAAVAGATPDIRVGGVPSRVTPTPDTHDTQMYRIDVREGSRSETTTDFLRGVKAEIWGYMQGESRTVPPPPDKDIVRQCVEALGRHSIEKLQELLHERFRQGYKPRNYAWFPKVIRVHFGSR